MIFILIFLDEAWSTITLVNTIFGAKKQNTFFS